MGLAEVQAGLARLYTDDALRERFFAAPEEVAPELGLTAKEAADIALIDRSSVDMFAESLRFKRFGEVKDQLPRTVAALGESAARDLFVEFARGFVPDGILKHRADALAFARYAKSALDGPAREAAIFDRTALGLFYSEEGQRAIPRRGPSFALARWSGRRVLLVRPRGSSRYRSIRLPF